MTDGRHNRLCDMIEFAEFIADIATGDIKDKPKNARRHDPILVPLAIEAA